MKKESKTIDIVETRNQALDFLKEMSRMKDDRLLLTFSKKDIWQIFQVSLTRFLVLLKENSPETSYKSTSRSALYNAKESLRQRQKSFINNSRKVENIQRCDTAILLCGRNHYEQIKPYINYLKQQKRDFTIILLRDYLEEDMVNEGYPYLQLQNYFRLKPERGILKWMKAINKQLDRYCLSQRNEEKDRYHFNNEEKAAFIYYISTQIHTILMKDRVINQVLQRICPKRFLVLNQSILSSNITLSICHHNAVKTYFYQHGDMMSYDASWQFKNVDLALLWGEKTKNVLIQHQWPEHSLSVIGSLQYWDLLRQFSKETVNPVINNFKNPEKNILIALSGAGLMSSMAQHVEDIKLLASVAKQLPMFYFLVRLHRKDKAEIFKNKGQAQKKIPKSGFMYVLDKDEMPEDILEHLRGVKLLITATSTVALEAIFLGVPVILLCQERRRLPDYAHSGACYIANSEKELISLVTLLMSNENNGLEEAMKKKAQTLILQSLGDLSLDVVHNFDAIFYKKSLVM